MELTPSGTTSAPPMATYGTDQPERSRANQVIMSRLLAEPQYQAVLKLVENYLPKFDIINMVVAMHMCALTARDHELLKRQIQFDPSFITLFHSVKEQVLGRVHEMSTRTMADLLWACARLDIFDSDLFNEVITDASGRLEMYSAHGISILVFALGYVGQRPRAVFMQALVREMRSRIDKEFDQQAISMVIYGMMRLGIRDDRLMKIITEHLLRTGFDRSEPLSLICTAYAYSKLEYWNANIFSSLGRSLIDCMKDLDSRLFIMASLCFAYSAGNLKESHFVMDEILRNAENRLQDLDNRGFATIVFAAGKYHQLKEDVETYKPVLNLQVENAFAKEVVVEVQRREYESFTMTEMNLICYGLMRMKYRNEENLQEFAGQFVTNAAELSTVEVLNALYAFGQMNFVHLQFIHAMVAEIKRRNLMDEMDTGQVAVLVYSLALCRICDEELMDKAAVITCQKVHEFGAQSMSMVIWGLAVLNCTAHAEPLVSACLEEVCLRNAQFDPSNIALIFWGSAILAGSSSALWALETLFQAGFWSQNFEEKHYAMFYLMYASLRVEAGMSAEDLDGWYMCRRIYELSTGERMGQQNERVAERLALKKVAHKANAMPPALQGFREAGIRADVVIERLKLVIEVEGPQRMTIPLDKTMAELGDDDVCGAPEDVISQVRQAVECGLTGSAAFKRRLLRKCGWRVVTVCFDENEEYIGDALGSLEPEKPKTGEGADTEAGGEEEEKAEEEKAEEGSSEEPEEAPGAPGAPAASAPLGEELTYTDGQVSREENWSAYERRVREQHRTAVKELRRRILEERGNAAASAAYSTHVEYRQWQVGLEKQVFKKMLAAL